MSRSLRPHGHQAPPSMGFSRQECWSGLPFPSPGNFPTQGSNPGLPHCRQMLSHLGILLLYYFYFIIWFPGSKTGGILAPPTGDQTSKSQVLTTELPGTSQPNSFYNHSFSFSELLVHFLPVKAVLCHLSSISEFY